ncbi:MAG TPA: S8 family serine peptidase, partial [Candidatus Eisenbacteria bacterium]|nr:S8 family serine peptidase [Candidatus Eisenbacteria bacterium]
YVWDQSDNVGPHPSGYGYGTEWNAASINAGTFREVDDDGHGTHVTGIAAGNGRAAVNPGEQYDYAGIAPEADIIFVKTIFNEDALIDGVAWIQNRAGVKPSSINLSVGSQYGPHDGTSNLDVALENLAGPGRIIVAAAGNEGNSYIHAEVQVPANGTVDMPFLVCTSPGTSCGYTPNSGNDSGRGNDWILLEGYSSSSNFTVTVLTPNQTQIGPVGSTGNASTNTSQGNVDIYASAFASTEREILIDIWDKSSAAPPATGTWIVRIHNNQPTVREIDFWIYFWQLGAGYVNVYWDDGTQAENAELISSPASSDSVIAVGAYITKTAWPCIANPGGGCGYISPPPLGEIAPFSSPGPRRDGLAKPEISAPGMGIASTLSANASGPLFISPYGEMPGGLRYVSQGTSQSSPHVAGAAALLLQRRPNASVRDVSLALMGTARHDSYTGAGYSNDFGYGKLDVAAAVELFVPVSLLSLTAEWQDGKAVVSWLLKETEEGVSFRVDRGPSVNGPFTSQSDWLHGDLSFTWTDPAPDAAEPWYRLRSLDRTGEEKLLGVVSLSAQPAITRLLANSPNPFRASTRIAFDLARPGNVTVDVLDIAGRLVTRLVSGPRTAGRNEIEWNGLDGAGRHVAPGIYVVRLTTPSTVLARRMVMAS